MTFSFSSQVLIPKIPWRKVKETILGKKFFVSVAVIGDKEMRRIRRILRAHKEIAKKFSKTHSFNVLSFRFSKKEGEIILHAGFIKKEARILKRPFRERLLYLYIHGLLHLKGYDHEKKNDTLKMEQEEQKFLKRFL